MRKLGRLVRSYEELRGPDIEGFVRFVREGDAAGAKEVEAFAEEEGADAVRLLTIHAAKGLEFKVVVVADAGRDRPPPSGEEILCLPDGRFGFKVADPATGRRKGAFDYHAVKEAEERADAAERLRLYYVALTRATDRLIVSGALDPAGAAGARTPIGWVVERLGGVDIAAIEGAAVELELEAARLLLRLNRFDPEAERAESPAVEAMEPQLSLFALDESVPVEPAAPQLAQQEPVGSPPLHAPRRLSYSALATFGQCPYKYFARYVVGMRERDTAGEGDELGATAIGSAVHEALERLDLAAPQVPDGSDGRFEGLRREDLGRLQAFVAAYCGSGLAARIAGLVGAATERPFAFEHDGVLLHGRLDVLHVAAGRALVVDFKTNALDGADPGEIVEREYRLQRLVYALACLRAGAEEVEVVYQFLERPDDIVSAAFRRSDRERLETELSAEIGRIREGRFVPTPSDFACSGCPALDVVCAGPRLHF
jgi:ATP-dependent helicase/nuclease subunit A